MAAYTLLEATRITAGEDDAQEHPDDVRRELVAHGELFGDFGLDEQASRLHETGSMPETLAHAPLIIDTDIGGDPDDAVALAIAARNVRELALVITSDERDGDRGRFARYFLDSLGRPDVPVVSGRQLTDTRYFCVDGVTPPRVPPQSADLAGAVLSVCGAATGPVRWVGLGPASNLADLLTAHPDLASRLAVTQMGGAIRYRRPDRAEHNFRLDPDAVMVTLNAIELPHFVISDVTFRTEIEISTKAPLYRWLHRNSSRGWAALLTANFDRWFHGFHPGSMLHDPLTLSVGLQLPYVEFSHERVLVSPDGRMRFDEQGTLAFVSHSADYEPFMRWVEAGLGIESHGIAE